MNKKSKKFKKVIIPISITLLIGITFFSCTNEKAKLKVICVLPDTVSFSRNILPIFSTQCSISGCHTSSSNAGHLNLEASAAYSELLHHGSGYVDTLNPEGSILYSKLISESGVMPPSGRLDDCKIKLVLEWIQQKAKNN